MRLRLRPMVEQYVASWGATATNEDRERIAQFLESAADGSWRSRWYPAPHRLLIDPDWTAVWPDKGLVVTMLLNADDEDDGYLWVEAMGIWRVLDETEEEHGMIPLWPPPE